MSWILIASALLAGGGEIEWQKGNLPKAFETARETGEPLMVYFRADWDRFSGQLDEGAFSDKDIVKLSEKFIRVLVDCSRKPVYREMTRLHQLEGIPSVFFFDDRGRKIASVVGYVPDTETYLLAMKESLVKKPQLPAQDWEERVERIIKRVDEKLERSMIRVRREIRELVRRSLDRLKKDDAKDDRAFDSEVDAFADRLTEDDKMHTRLRAFLKSEKGKRFIRGQMNMLGVDELEEAIQHYFRKDGDGTYSVRPDFKLQMTDFLDQAWPEPKKKGVRLGFSGREVSAETRGELDLESGMGIRISRVVAEGAAEKSGMKEGDVLIFLAGRQVGPDSIREVIGTLSPGRKVSAVVLREGKRVRLSLVPLEKE